MGTRIVIFAVVTFIATLLGVAIALYLPNYRQNNSNVSSLRKDCVDMEGEWQIAVDDDLRVSSNCSVIGQDNPDWCETDEVSQNCEKTCGIINGVCDPGCVDSTESFIVWGELGKKTCDLLEYRPSNCEKEVYQNNCPVTCNTCPEEEGQFQYMQCQDNDKQCCNGLESNCDLLLNEILFATIHNAMHDDLPLQNHNKPLEDALEAGYRGLQLDLCECGNKLVFCHSSCNIGK